MIHFITQIKKVNDDFTVVCLFNTNETRIIDLSEWVAQFRAANDGWVSRLADINYFKTAGIDSYGTLKWDNEIDFCRNVLYSTIKPIAA